VLLLHLLLLLVVGLLLLRVWRRPKGLQPAAGGRTLTARRAAEAGGRRIAAARDQQQRGQQLDLWVGLRQHGAPAQ
jgi:hypothetical protein